MSFDISPRMLLGFDETWIAKLAVQYIEPGDIVYDVGAHVGYTTLLFAKTLAGSGAVHAFEILPSTSDGFLKQTINANALSNVVIHTVGLSDASEVIGLSIGTTKMASLETQGSQTGLLVEMCRTKPLDQYVKDLTLPPPSFIKVDIERSEVRFLRGAIQTISQYQPVMVIEFHTLDLLREGYSLLTELGYRCFGQSNQVMDEVALSQLEHFHESVLCVPRLH